jgi:hypothetical protein
MRKTAPLLALVLLGCAQMGAPPGGPVDDTPPSILSTFPAADSTRVRPPFAATITFSEKMDKRSVEKTLRVFPTPGRIRTDWEKTTLLIEADFFDRSDAMPKGPITILVSGRAEDRRGNKIREPYSFSFTSAESLPRGSVSGAIEGLSKSAKAPPATVRAILPAEGDSTPARILLESEASREGAFRLRPLPVGDGGPRLVLAFQDETEDGAIDFERELYGYSDSFALTPEHPAADSLRIRLVSADTPGSIEGTVPVDEGTDSLVVAVEAEDDTAAAPSLTEPDSTGAYRVTDLQAGSYRVRLLRGSIERMRLEGPDSATSVLSERSLVLRPGEAVEEFRLPEEAPEPQVTH